MNRIKITIVICFLALLVNLIYFSGKSSYTAEFISLFLINIFGFISSLIQVLSFLKEQESSEIIKNIHDKMFPQSVKQLKEKYKNYLK